jgi:hypothetical protein
MEVVWSSIAETECAYCAVQAESLIQVKLDLQNVHFIVRSIYFSFQKVVS